MCGTRLAGNTGRKKIAKKSQSGHHCTTLSDCIFATKTCRLSIIGKKVLGSNMCSTCFHSMVNFGPLTAEIGLGVCGTPANFDECHVLPSSLQRRRSTDLNQTLHNVWPPSVLVHYIYIFGGYCPLREFCQVQNSVNVQVLRSPILAVRHSSSGRQPNFAESYKQWNYGTFPEGAIYIRQGSHHVGHRPTF